MADFITVGWMLSVMTTLLCELGALAVGIAITQRPDSRVLHSLVDVLLFAALVIGLGSVAFLPVLWRIRTVPPPKPIAVAAVLIGLAPMVIAIARAALAT